MSELIRYGPYHPIHLEPEIYQVHVRDGKITQVDIEQGFTHRGIERLLERQPLKQGVLLAERVCGLCSQAHAEAYCSAIENALSIAPPVRAACIRALAFELDRLHSHFMWFVLLFHSLGDARAFTAVLNERESLMDLIEFLFGNRVHFTINTPGGVKRNVPGNAAERIKTAIAPISKLADFVSERVEMHAKRLEGIGILTKEKAKAYGVVGPVLRGSGIESDIRKDDPYLIYDEVEFNVPTEDSCDVLGRTRVRVSELYESLRIISQVVDRMPEGELSAELPAPPVNEDCGRVEAPRGELIYFVRLGGTNFPDRVKLRPPTYVNDPAVAEMLIGEPVDNLPLVLESLDRCISCTNRITLIDERTGDVRKISLEEVSRWRR
jgi:NADH-quinone oxidoreductase subunit D